VLLLLRRRPGITVAELADELHISGKAVRRHLNLLADAGMVRTLPAVRRGAGRPAAGWEVTAGGCEALPRNYDGLAMDLLDDLTDALGPDGVEAVLARRTDKLASEYRVALAGSASLGDQVRTLAVLRDEEGYVATSEQDGDGWRLVEHHCAVQRAAQRHPALCAMELSVLRQVLGPDVEVERDHHLLGGDTCCCYHIRSRCSSPAASSAPAVSG
jgi:predicted ArsR family transcriptional regulator